jgi:hypothetical protein
LHSNIKVAKSILAIAKIDLATYGNPGSTYARVGNDEAAISDSQIAGELCSN